MYNLPKYLAIVKKLVSVTIWICFEAFWPDHYCYCWERFAYGNYTEIKETSLIFSCLVFSWLCLVLSYCFRPAITSWHKSCTFSKEKEWFQERLFCLLQAFWLVAVLQVCVACFHRLTLTAVILGSDGTCAAILIQGCTEGSNLALTSSVEKDSVLKSFLRYLFIASCSGCMLKMCVSLEGL